MTVDVDVTLNGAGTVILEPAQGWPAPLTICATLPELFPFVSGLAITEISPPSKELNSEYCGSKLSAGEVVKSSK